MAPSPAIAAADRPSGWVRGPAFDLFWLHGGLWLAPLALGLAWMGGGRADQGPAQWVYLALSAAFWIGHRFSSTWLAWASCAYGPARRAQWWRFIGVPVLVVGVTLGVVLAPDGWLPGTWLQRVVVLAAVDYLLVSYHFAAQHFGLLSLYRGRAGRGRDATSRTLDRAFALGVGGVLVVAAEVLQGAALVPDAWLRPLAQDAVIDVISGPLQAVLGTVTVLATAALLIRERQRDSPPGRQLYVLGLGVMTLSAFWLDPAVFVFCWTAQHWLAAVGLAGVVLEGETYDAESGALPRWLHGLHRRPSAWFVVICLLSAVFMPLYEVEAVGTDTTTAVGWLDAHLGGILTQPSVVQPLVALGLSTAFLHYLLDRAVWRLSDGVVRAAARPLLEPR